MRKEKGLTAILVSGAIMYVLLGVAFIQNAKAEDVSVWSIAQAKAFVTDDEMEWGVYYAVNVALNAQVNSHAFMIGLANSDDRTDAYAMYEKVYDVLNACAYNGKSAQSITFEVLGQHDDDTQLGSAMSMYFMGKCSDELKALNGVNHKTGGTGS